MRLLLDTQALLALLMSPARVPEAARQAVAETRSGPVVSAVSVWEIAIKRAIGKLPAPDNLLEILDRHAYELLPVTPMHAWATAELPMHHRDPFDRLLVAQARLEGLAIVSGDSAFAVYGVPVVW